MSEKSPEILIIPIDNRPVCYDLIKDTASILSTAKIHMPDISLLGGLSHDASTEKILGWAKHTLIAKNIDIAIIALDTIAYGGLIPSRCAKDSLEEIKAKVNSFIEILTSVNKKVKIFGFSSIMRISDNNCGEEEKSYWENYGRDLFKYSYLSHKLLKHYDVEIEAELIKLAREIPFEIVEDYLDTRKRNYELNSYYIDLAKKGVFDKLIFSQDDAAEYGFNIEEKELLTQQAIKEQISDKVFIKTGADEMILSLLSASLAEYYNISPKIQVKYFNHLVKTMISRYEDTSIDKSVTNTIKLCGAELYDRKGDLTLLVNAPNEVQNDLCLGIYNDKISNKQAEEIIKYYNDNDEPTLIADIKCANGADTFLVEKLLDNKFDTNKLYGYAAWNTTGNTLGTVIACAIIKFIAIQINQYNEEAFKKHMYIRLLDDWAYQANVRKSLREKGSTDTVEDEMKPFAKKVANYLDFRKDPIYGFPWNRTFEIKISI